jgi:hypothetical protein
LVQVLIRLRELEGRQQREAFLEAFSGLCCVGEGDPETLVNEVELEDLPILLLRSVIFKTYEDQLSLHDDLATKFSLQSMYTLKERLGGQSLLSFAPFGLVERVHANRSNGGQRCFHFRWKDRESQLRYSYEFTQGDPVRIHLLHQRLTKYIWLHARETERGEGNGQILLLDSPFGSEDIACTRGELYEMTTTMLSVWPIELRYEDTHLAAYREYRSHGIDNVFARLPAGHHLQHSLGLGERNHISAQLVRRAYLNQAMPNPLGFDPSLCQSKEVALFDRYVVAHKSRSLFIHQNPGLSHLPRDIVISLNRDRS